MHRTVRLALLSATLALAGAAHADDLVGFLTAVSATTPRVPIRATGELLTTSPEGTLKQQITIVQRPNGDLYLALQPSGARAVLPATGEALYSPGTGKPAAPFALDAAFGGTEFSREDLLPFAIARFGSPTIVDRNGSETTVSLDPHTPSQYSLEVITFDRDKQAPVKVMVYKDTLSNLLKMRRDSGLVQVGGRWRPTTVTMENFPMRTTDTLTLTWTEVPDDPTLFDGKAWK